MQETFDHLSPQYAAQLKSTWQAQTCLTPTQLRLAHDFVVCTVVMCRNTQVGVPCNRACSACYTHMSLTFQGAAFVLPPRTDTQSSSAKSHKKSHGDRQGQGKGRAGEKALVLGEPLPDLGVCKHYHNSHRRAVCLALNMPLSFACVACVLLRTVKYLA